MKGKQRMFAEDGRQEEIKYEYQQKIKRTKKYYAKDRDRNNSQRFKNPKQVVRNKTIPIYYYDDETLEWGAED